MIEKHNVVPADMEVGFYHLTQTGIKQALPLLAGKVLAKKEKSIIRCSTKKQVKDWDQFLWEVEHPLWLPHGCVGESYPELCPIWLTCAEEAPNNAQYLFLLYGAEPFFYSGLKRISILFEEKETEHLQKARVLWQEFKKENTPVVYWLQGKNGWVKQAL